MEVLFCSCCRLYSTFALMDAKVCLAAAILGIIGVAATAYKRNSKPDFLYRTFRVPLVAYSLALGLYGGYVLPGQRWSWFSYHPLLMTSAFIAFAGNAIFLKKIGGYANTKSHGILMSVAVLLGLVGWYVIHSNKDMYKKQHLTTAHAKLGAAGVVMYLLIWVVGAVALHPDFGIMRTNSKIRSAHKWTGKGATLIVWLATYLGFATMEKGFFAQLFMVTPLIVLALYLVL